MSVTSKAWLYNCETSEVYSIVKYCKIPSTIDCIYFCHASYVFGLCYVRGFSNRKLDSESSGAYQQWNNCIKADSQNFYLHGFCLLYGLDASLDLLLMLLASKLFRYDGSLPLPFFPPAAWLFEAVLCFQSATS